MFGIALLLATFSLAADQQPTQVTALRAEFRAGQTFLTWRQVEGEQVRYRIYRSATPIAKAEDLSPEHLVAEVHDHTSLNLMASIDRIALSNTRPPNQYVIPNRVYFVIKEGEPPLSPTMGLFVYTARSDETAYYAVTAVSAGQENSEIVVGEAGNALAAGVAERVEQPTAIRQNGDGDYAHWTADVDAEHYPAMSSLPSVAYNFRIRTPEGPGPHPLIGILHGALLQYNKVGMNFGADNRAVRVSLDSPVMRGRIEGLPDEQYPMGGWYGYNSNFGTDRPLADGKMVDYVVRRVLWTLSWIERTLPIDADRVSLRGGSMGGGGCLAIGLLHPDRFAAIHGFIPYLPSGARGGASPMAAISPAKHLAEHPAGNFPFLLCTVGRTDHIVGWQNKLELAQAAQQSRAGFALYWDLRDHSQTYNGEPPPGLELPAVYWGRAGGQPEMPLGSFSRKQSFPAISELTANSDPGTVDLAVRPDRRPALDTPGVGDLIGSINGWVDWDRESIVDRSDRWEISLRLPPHCPADSATAQVTPRRLQQFRPVAGESYAWSVSDASGHTRLAGKVTADQFSLVTVPGVPLGKENRRLVIRKEN
jgi:S-formylglutathione hydrolase